MCKKWSLVVDFFKSDVCEKAYSRGQLSQRDRSVCDTTQHPPPCRRCTHSNSMHALLLLLHAGAEHQHGHGRKTHSCIWRPRRRRIPQRVGYSEESPYYDVQPGAARALQSIWNRPSVHETVVDTTAIKTKTTTTKGQTDNKPFQIFHCLRAVVPVKQWFPQLCSRRPRRLHSNAARCTKRVTGSCVTGIMWPLHIQGGAQDVKLLLITWSKRQTKSFILSWRKSCYSNLHKLGKPLSQSTGHDQEMQQI